MSFSANNANNISTKSGVNDRFSHHFPCVQGQLPHHAHPLFGRGVLQVPLGALRRELGNANRAIVLGHHPHPAVIIPCKPRGTTLPGNYSHSIVAGGFELMSYTTRFTPATSLMIRVEMRAKRS